MNRDFTHEKLCLLYNTLLKKNYRFITLNEYFKASNSYLKTVIIRHDVDRKIQNALDIAKIERNLGIVSSYYFRCPATYDAKIISDIHDLGHEIGYHYEVLAEADGDFSRAIGIFEKKLSGFRKICEVTTICAHGSPLSRWDNRDLWKKYNFQDYGIVGDAHVSIGPEVCYFSDTGRAWDMKENLRDTINAQKIVQNVHSTDDLIEYFSSHQPPSLYLVIHPERWNKPGFSWNLQLMRDMIFNTGKKVLRRVR